MISKMYYNDLRKALKASFKNEISCYQNAVTKAKIWLRRGVVVFFEES